MKRVFPCEMVLSAASHNYVIAGLDVSPLLFQYAKNGNNFLKAGTKVAVLEDGPPAWLGTGELRHSHGCCFLPFPSS